MVEIMTQNKKQEMFKEMVLGVLLYSVVLGFFNDYTDILTTGSYSVTFAVAIVMQILTFLTLKLKDYTVRWFKQKENSRKVALGFSIWLIMFLSKFVFLGVIDVIFGEQVEISGFVGLLAIIICLTIAQNAVEYLYKKLGD